MLILPRRASRKACAPNETRRPNGELGTPWGEVLSCSSVTASSAFPEFEPTELEKLPRRKAREPNEVCVGEPDSPRVEIDGLRGWLD